MSKSIGECKEFDDLLVGSIVVTIRMIKLIGMSLQQVTIITLVLLLKD